MFEELLKESGGRLLMPGVIAFVFATFVKALFELRRSKGSKTGVRVHFPEKWTLTTVSKTGSGSLTVV